MGELSHLNAVPLAEMLSLSQPSVVCLGRGVALERPARSGLEVPQWKIVLQAQTSLLGLFCLSPFLNMIFKAWLCRRRFSSKCPDLRLAARVVCFQQPSTICILFFYRGKNAHFWDRREHWRDEAISSVSGAISPDRLYNKAEEERCNFYRTTGPKHQKC